MNNTCVAALLCLSLLTAPALASGLVDPMITPEVIAADTTGSAGGLDLAIPAFFIFLAILTAAGAL
ncbi:hypothetical protein SAMN05444414_11776 [Roseovarius marisflavi]|uniref:Ferrochelatase n=1 Tax=Roseovarius marisflavi TaxID=1054996 RepID=A0A1M7BDE8_9RHOB|nr:hypothetical protein [Roseovarius marisflavi]SHL52977.1 hypothetical protein SAMN05444414_11776 [Roseovarius marisflavi]